MDKHLKTVRETTWDVRAKWRDIGVELGISVGTLEVSHYVTICCSFIPLLTQAVTGNERLFLVHRQLNVITAIRLVTVSFVCWSSG